MQVSKRIAYPAFVSLALMLSASALQADFTADRYLRLLDQPHEWKEFDFGVEGRAEFERDVEGSSEPIHGSQVGVFFSSTPVKHKDWGVNVNADYSILSFREAAALGDAYHDGYLGAKAYYQLDDDDLRLEVTGGIVTKHDNEDFSSSDLYFEGSALVHAPINDHWTFVGGVYYQDRTLDGTEEPFPIPAASVIWRPSERLRVILGSPITGFFIQPTDWLSIRGYSAFLTRNELELIERVPDNDRFDFRQFIRYERDSYELSDELVHQDGARIGYERIDVGVGATWRPYEWMRLDIEYAYQTHYRWRNYDAEGVAQGDPIRLDEGSALSLRATFRF